MEAGRKVTPFTELTWEVYWGRGGEGTQRPASEVGSSRRRRKRETWEGPAFYKWLWLHAHRESSTHWQKLDDTLSGPLVLASVDALGINQRMGTRSVLKGCSWGPEGQASERSEC